MGEKEIQADDFGDVWKGFLDARMRAIMWFRRFGNEGEEMDFEEIADVFSCDPTQAKLIFMTGEEKGL